MIPLTVHALFMGSIPGKSVIMLRPCFETGSKPRVLPIHIGMPEAMSISMALENKQSRRPQTHDLTVAIIEELGGTFLRAVIDRVDGMTFYSKIVLEQDDDIIEIDARPSDAIAMAMRMQAPIYVEEPVFTVAATNFDSSGKRNDEQQIEAFHDYVESLTPDDFKAPGAE